MKCLQNYRPIVFDSMRAHVIFWMFTIQSHLYEQFLEFCHFTQATYFAHNQNVAYTHSQHRI